MNPELVALAVTVAVASPAAALAIIGVSAAAGLRASERLVGGITQIAMVACTAFLVAASALLVGAGASAQRITVPLTMRGGLDLELLVDAASLSFATGAAVICAIAARFSYSYLHRDPGFRRYFILFNAFVLGVLLIALAGGVSLLFAGWELLGASSALLVGFFQDRPAPLKNALRVLAVYRVGDAAMLAAAVVVHHSLGSGRLHLLFADDATAHAVSPAIATIVALLLSIAVAAKCAQLPFSGWIPRAMEGPTPSSAVFYGAISVHAGALVLIRAAPILEQAPVARGLIVLMGVCTALFATAVGRVQTDIKCSLAFASLTQVSIVLVEIGLGFYSFALLHMAGHAFVRLLQFLRSPSVLHDFHEAENALGGHMAPRGRHLERLLPPRWRAWLYRFALERGYVDAGLDRYVVGPVLWTGRALNGLERRWCAWIGGEERTPAAAPHSLPAPPED